MPEITIQLVTWNSAAALRKSLSALQQVDPRVAHIRVIDNGSTDDSVALVKNALPHAHILQLETNTGFAGGHNAGLQQCVTEFVLVLNPDVEIVWAGIQQTLAAFADPEVGAVQGKLYQDGRTLDSTGIVLTAALNGVDRGAGQLDTNQYNEIFSLAATTGACSMYRLRALRQIAWHQREIFDEDFWAYKEDVDVGWRLRRAGWKVLYVPVTVGVHPRSLKREGRLGWGWHANAVWRRLRDRRTAYSWRNWLWLIVKNVTGRELFGHGFAIVGRLVVFVGLTLVYWPWFMVWWKTLRGVPRMIAKRT